MIYGRVIGNELRDVPPECLPIWGQRWSGYRAPHGPSPFSTRIFSVDQMSEVGPALTSPTQFEAAFAEEDEWDDARSESSQLHGSFSSPLTNQTVTTEPTLRPETPTPRFIHRSPNHPRDSPNMLHRSTGHPPPQDSICFGTVLLPRVEFEQPDIQHHASEPLSHASGLRHGISGQSGHRSLENNYTLWDMDRTSTSTLPRAGPSQGSHVPSGQLQCTMPPYSILEWQFANAYTQSSAYPFQPNPSSRPGSDHFIQPFQADDQISFIPTTPPSSSRFFPRTLPQQNVGINSSWNHESSVTMIPGTAHPHNSVMAQWPLELVPLDLSSPIPLQNSGSSLDLEPFYYLISDHHRNSSRSEDLLGTLAHAESCTLLSPDNPRDDQYIR